jgi:hypothetical protein
MKLFGWFKKSKAPSREPQTHDYGPGRRFWGHDYSFKMTGPSSGRVTGWGHGLRKRDFILLADQHGGRARYLIENIEYADNPNDMWFADVIFSPRQMTQEERDAEAIHGGGNSDIERSEFIS